MSALLYGVVPTHLEIQNSGVAGMPVLPQPSHDLCVLYSIIPESYSFGTGDVLTFHSVLAAALERTDLVPFRFPTVVPVQEIEQHLERVAAKFSAALNAISGCVQMNLQWPTKQAPVVSSSGSSYLRSKAAESRRVQDAAEEVCSSLRPFVSSAVATTKKGQLIVQALVSRDRVGDFIAHVRSSFPQARITGPWPPSAFIETPLHV